MQVSFPTDVARIALGGLELDLSISSASSESAFFGCPEPDGGGGGGRGGGRGGKGGKVDGHPTWKGEGSVWFLASNI